MTESPQRAGEVVEEFAPAKVNLSLDVLGLRPDGFHELRSVMQTISLGDTLTLWRGKHGGPSENAEDFSLVDRAIQRVVDHVRGPDDVAYALRKRIPFGAGLGGGSSDAVAAMRGTCRLLHLNLGDSDLHEIASSLGSDVPFFLNGGTALVEGRGERVRPMDPLPETWFLLVGHGKPVSTKEVFETFDQSQTGGGLRTKRVLDALHQGRVVLGGNDLEVAAIRAFPEIGHTLATLSECLPADQIAMSGSGGTLMAIFPTGDEAYRVQSVLAARVPWSCVARSIPEKD